jgi:hypothetical protein
VGDKTALPGNEEGASQDTRGIRGDKRYCFLTILDNVLTVDESTGHEERTGHPHPHPGDLLEEA